jgi:hypothetical protein
MAMGSGLLGSLRRMLGKIPFIGGAAASALGFLPFAIGGALGVEPTLQLARFLSPYLPAIPSSLYYVGTSLVVAALVQKFLPVAPATREKIAVAIAAAGGGVAFYKMRTGQDADVQTETGMLEMAGVGGFAGMLGDSLGLGDGFQTSIVPYAGYGGYGSAIYGV